MNKLKTFFSDEQLKTTNQNVLIFDMHNLIFRTLHVANYSYTQSWAGSSKQGYNGPKEMTEQDMYSYWKYLMVNSIFTALKNFQPDKLIFAIDGGKGSWRKDVYPLYKANRKVSRDKSTIDFDKFFPILDAFIIDMQKALPNVYFIRLEKVEGDDVIAIIAKNILQKGSNITIISSDRDLVQLMKNKNVKLYDPMKKTFIKSINPEQDLFIKIIGGDSSDNIPAIKKKCGKKTAAKILSDGIEVHLVNDEIRANYKRNTLLIDFNFIPKPIVEGIEDSYNNHILSTYSGIEMFNFLVRNRITKFIDELQTIYSPMLKKLS